MGKLRVMLTRAKSTSCRAAGDETGRSCAPREQDCRPGLRRPVQRGQAGGHADERRAAPGYNLRLGAHGQRVQRLEAALLGGGTRDGPRRGCGRECRDFVLASLWHLVETLAGGRLLALRAPLDDQPLPLATSAVSPGTNERRGSGGVSAAARVLGSRLSGGLRSLTRVCGAALPCLALPCSLRCCVTTSPSGCAWRGCCSSRTAPWRSACSRASSRACA